MSERNKAVVYRLVEEVMNAGRLDVLDVLYSPPAGRPGSSARRPRTAPPPPGPCGGSHPLREGHPAPRGALSYSRPSREELGGRFLGLMAYLAPKG